MVFGGTSSARAAATAVAPVKFLFLRLLLPFLACSLLGVSAARAQAPAGMPPGVVLVAKVEGRVEMTLNGQVTALAVDAQIPQAAKVVTFENSSVVLVFSNGATTCGDHEG